MSDEPDLYKYENLISEEAKIVCFDAPADQVNNCGSFQFIFSSFQVQQWRFCFIIMAIYIVVTTFIIRFKSGSLSLARKKS